MKKRILTITLSLIILTIFQIKAQEQADTLRSTVEGILTTLDLKNRLKISGYIQAQYQVADSGGTKSFAGGDFENGVDKRFYLRRGRIKFQYDAAAGVKGWSTSQYVLQFDVSQKGLAIKDAFAKFTDPWSGWFSVTAGMQNRPFGYEIVYSSGLRESPERGRMSQIIFPNERDLGAMLTIQGPKTSRWNWIKLDVGMFNGTGAPSAGANTSDFDKFKDIIGHLSISRSTKSEKIKWGLGASFYEGGFRQDVSDRYKFGTDSLSVKGFTLDQKSSLVSVYPNNQDKTKRSYIGFDGQVSIDWFLGITTFRGEYIQGEQPATSGSSSSPSSLPTSSETIIVKDTAGAVKSVTTTATVISPIYIRKFNGAYFYFLQNIGQTPWQAIVKYDWYDANTDLKGDEIGNAVKTTGFKNSNATDIKYTTLGLGLAYRWDANVKITAYYDIVKNETTANIPITAKQPVNYSKDLLDNVFTLRVQVKF